MAFAEACRIIKSNYQIIASENPTFDAKELDDWVEKHGSGYFLRDETSPFDCRYIMDSMFLQMYVFEKGDEGAIFRRVSKL